MKFIPLLALLALLASCDSDTTSSVPPGDIVGYVFLQDTINTRMKNHADVTVSIEGTSLRTTSDSNGKWVLRNVPPGTYVLVFQKEGFGMNKIYSVQHTGNGTLFLSSLFIQGILYQIPSFSIDLILRPFEKTPVWRDSSWVDSLGNVRHQYVVVDSTLYSRFSAIKTSISYIGGIFFYFGKSLQIDAKNPNSYNFQVFANLPDSANRSAYIFRDTLIARGFQPGEEIFVKGIAVVGSYYDQFSEKSIITDVINSEAKSFILP